MGYTWKGQLGRGNYGVVHAFVSELDQQEYAIKFLRILSAAKATETKFSMSLRKFNQEVADGQRMSDLGLGPRIFHSQYFPTSHSAIIIQQLIDGSLVDLLRREPSPSQVTEVFERLMTLLEKLRRFRITFGDFHPGNIVCQYPRLRDASPPRSVSPGRLPAPRSPCPDSEKGLGVFLMDFGLVKMDVDADSRLELLQLIRTLPRLEQKGVSLAPIVALRTRCLEYYDARWPADTITRISAQSIRALHRYYHERVFQSAQYAVGPHPVLEASSSGFESPPARDRHPGTSTEPEPAPVRKRARRSPSRSPSPAPACPRRVRCQRAEPPPSDE
jgi:hypothetical protein